jgi:hypothetical protein
MWRLTRNNGITEGFQTKMEVLQRRELSVINRLIVAEGNGPVARRYSFPVGILLGR